MASRADWIFTIVLFITLIVYLGGLYGQTIISGSVNPKFDWNPLVVIGTFVSLTQINTGYKFLGFLVAALIATVIWLLIELIRGA